MLPISRIFGIEGKQNNNKTEIAEVEQKEISWLEQGGGFDTVDFKNTKTITKGEKFEDVFAEFNKNVPDQTSTTEDKEKAISYIKRMLECEDITPELKNYWENKKDVIQMEIQMIKNEQQAGKDSNYQYVIEEYNNFVQQHWCDNYPEERNKNLEFLDSEEYGLTFYDTCISYLNRILACEDLPENARTHFEQGINHWNAEKQSRLGEINWYKQNHDIKTESFEDIFAEFDKNVPDSTSTIEEKKLACSYIKRMILCDDITPELKDYWINKQNVIEMEIQNIKNEQQINQGEKVEDVWKEFQEFQKNYLNSLNDNMSIEQKFENRAAYYNAIFSFVARLVNCTDVTESQMAAFSNLEYQADIDLTGWERDFDEYQNHS